MTTTCKCIHILNRPISNEPTKYLGIKIEYTPRDVVRQVNIFNCLAYEWIVLRNESTILTKNAQFYNNSITIVTQNYYFFRYKRSIVCTRAVVCWSSSRCN